MNSSLMTNLLDEFLLLLVGVVFASNGRLFPFGLSMPAEIEMMLRLRLIVGRPSTFRNGESFVSLT